VGATGNITNTTLGTITDSRFIPYSTTALAAGGTGDIAAFAVSAGGIIQVVAYPPGHANVTSGTTVTCGGCWISNN
jgi:hypothetical protein